MIEHFIGLNVCFQMPDVSAAASVAEDQSTTSAPTSDSSSYSTSSSTSFSFISTTLGTTVSYGTSESLSTSQSSSTTETTPYEDLHQKIEDLERSNKYSFNRLKFFLYILIFSVILLIVFFNLFLF